MMKRASGVLCHITCLPAPYGVGDLGPAAYRFADFLAAAKQTYWQVLPVHPTNGRYADSPYSSLSSCAGNTVLISPDLLREEGLLTEEELADHPPFAPGRADYRGASRFKERLYAKAYARFRERTQEQHDYRRFCRGQAGWLDDYALFSAISTHLDRAPLGDWPSQLKDPHGPEVERLRHELDGSVQLEKFLQYLFHKQWNALKRYCNGRGILLIGDFPMFMNYDCADIWTSPHLFKVDAEKRPCVVAGSPPDSFSAKGQLFNCAVYDWDALRRDHFDWWKRRFHSLFKLFDLVRIDHFRGLVAYWEVPAGEKNALNGSWAPGGVDEFMSAMLGQFPAFPVIAEDLGVITADVREAMGRYRIPGIRMMVFAFHEEGYASSFLPHNHIEDCVFYTGTHDTDTLAGAFGAGGCAADRERLFRYLGRALGDDLSWELIRMALMSVARTAIVQMQDLLAAGSEARMNTPGEVEGNWQWRLTGEESGDVAARLAEMTVIYGRA